MDGVDPALEIGPTTEIIAGEGRILTAGGDRRARALHLPADRRRGGRRGRDDADRRRHRPGRGHARDDLHAVAVGDPRDAARARRRSPVNVLLLGKGNTVSARGPARAGAGRRRRLQAARGLGLDAGGDRRLPARRRRDRRAGRDPHRHAQRGRLRRVDARRRSPAGRSTPTTPRARAAATRRTSSRSLSQPERPAVARRTRRARTRSTRSTSTWTC